MKVILGIYKAIKQSRRSAKKGKGKKITELYQHIQSGVHSEGELKALVFANNKNIDGNFHQSKEALKSELINQFLSFDVAGTEIQEAYAESYKKFAAFRLLLGKGYRDAAIALARQAIRKAIKYHFTELSLSFAKALMLHFAAIEIDENKYQQYAEICLKYQGLLFNETKLEYNLSRVESLIAKRKKLSDSTLEELFNIKDSSKHLIKSGKSYRMIILYGNICSRYYQHIGDLESLIQICTFCNNYFDTLPQMPVAVRVSFAFKMIPAYIKTQQYQVADTTVSECMQLKGIGPINEERLRQYQVINHFHQGQFEAAHQVCTGIENSVDKEFWLILSHYAQLLTGNKIRIGRFLNEVPQFSKDKIGMNTNILIIQTLSYLARNERHKVIDRLDALKHYAYRYLKEDNTIRTNAFLQILIKLESAYFNVTNLKIKAGKYLEQLEALPLEASAQDVDMEVVPYERLWGFVVGCLTS